MEIKFRYDIWLLNIQTKVFSNQRSYREYHVFLNYFAIFHINYFIIACLMPFRNIFYENNTFNYLFSIRIGLFSHFLKSDTTFGYSLKRGTVQIRPLFTGS